MPGENRHQSSSNLKGHHMLDNYAIMEQQQQQQHHQPAADLSEPVGNGSLQELYAQLVQKERDLLLAAQLGKALLEKNEELGLQNEKMAEEYSRQLEVSSKNYLSSLIFVGFSFVRSAVRSDNTQPTYLSHWRQENKVNVKTDLFWVPTNQIDYTEHFRITRQEMGGNK